MNEAIKAGEVFKLAELVPYVDGKIVNMDVVHNDKMGIRRRLMKAPAFQMPLPGGIDLRSGR